MLDFGTLILGHLVGDYVLQNDWIASRKTQSHVACLLHVVLYTAAIALLVQLGSPGWPWWAYAIVAAVHYPVDRWRMAAWWMRRVSGQAGFAKDMGPWSVIIVDNIFHLLTLWGLWVLVPRYA